MIIQSQNFLLVTQTALYQFSCRDHPVKRAIRMNCPLYTTQRASRLLTLPCRASWITPPQPVKRSAPSNQYLTSLCTECTRNLELWTLAHPPTSNSHFSDPAKYIGQNRPFLATRDRAAWPLGQHASASRGTAVEHANSCCVNGMLGGIRCRKTTHFMRAVGANEAGP
jgi:hypothetical protein